MKRLILIPAILALFVDCGQSKHPISIKHRFEAGMCAGLCIAAIQIEKNKVVFTRTNNEKAKSLDKKFPETRLEGEITSGEWQKISRLANEIEFKSLPAEIKGPGAADCGKMSLEVGFDDASVNKTAYECYPPTEAPPAELMELDRLLRGIEGRLGDKNQND